MIKHHVLSVIGQETFKKEGGGAHSMMEKSGYKRAHFEKGGKRNE